MKDKKDLVNHPPHYTNNKWEVIEILQEFFPKEPLLWQCGKYLFRCLYKGDMVQDLKKMIWYANKRIELEENERRHRQSKRRSTK